MKRGLGFLGALFWSALTLSTDFFIGREVYGQIRTWGYSPIPGTIMRSQVVRNGMVSRPEIAYEYDFGGRAYHASRLRYGVVSERGSWASEVVAAYRVGAVVPVYCDPRDPAEAVLVRGLEGRDLFMPMFLTPFNIVMLCIWAACVRSKWESEGHAAQSGIVLLAGLLLLETFLGSFVVVFLGIPLGYNGRLPPLGIPAAVWIVILVATPFAYIVLRHEKGAAPAASPAHLPQAE